MKDYSHLAFEELQRMPLPLRTRDIEGLRKVLVDRAMNADANSRQWRRAFGKLAQLDSALMGRSARWMFWIAIFSLAVTAVVAGIDLYLRLKCS